MLTAVRPATDDSFVSEANVPLSFSPTLADPRTCATPTDLQAQTHRPAPTVSHVPFPADRTVDHTTKIVDRKSQGRLHWAGWGGEQATLGEFDIFGSKNVKFISPGRSLDVKFRCGCPQTSITSENRKVLHTVKVSTEIRLQCHFPGICPPPTLPTLGQNTDKYIRTNKTNGVSVKFKLQKKN